MMKQSLEFLLDQAPNGEPRFDDEVLLKHLQHRIEGMLLMAHEAGKGQIDCKLLQEAITHELDGSLPQRLKAIARNQGKPPSSALIQQDETAVRLLSNAVHNFQLYQASAETYDAHIRLAYEYGVKGGYCGGEFVGASGGRGGWDR